jgi:DNA replicative helicase MCM subunit Mcm2 (Cdc46/Mcm family)
MKVKDKFILCNGCNHKYTITFTNKERVKESKCPNCKKINKTPVNETEKKNI